MKRRHAQDSGKHAQRHHAMQSVAMLRKNRGRLTVTRWISRCHRAALTKESIASEEWIGAAQHAENLHIWLAKGGFPPGGGKLRRTSIDALLAWLISHPNREEH
jgi:hypothetical protein